MKAKILANELFPIPFGSKCGKPLFFMWICLLKNVWNISQREYGKFSEEELIESIEKIRKRLGNQHAKRLWEAIKLGDLKKACEISLVYYDKSYDHGVAKRNPSTIHKKSFDELEFLKVWQMPF